jgi:hypothetical protein
VLPVAGLPVDLANLEREALARRVRRVDLDTCIGVGVSGVMRKYLLPSPPTNSSAFQYLSPAPSGRR